MKHVYVSEIAQYVGQEVILKGWLYNKRSSGKIMFPQIRDGSGIIQGVVLKTQVPERVWEDLDHLPQESSLIVRGTVREEKRAPGGYEIEIHDVEVVSVAEPYPLGKKDHGIEFLLDHRHLWLRSRRPHAVLKIRHEVIRAIREFLDSNGFVLCDAPIFTPAACEGTTTLFEVNYFEDQKAYLTQSGQLYNEAACMAFGKVYCFGPTFRAERSKTRRHLTEFWMVEPEVAYATLEDIMELAEQLVTFIIERVLERRRAELQVLERDISRLENIRPPFPRIRYDEAVERLREGGFEFSWGDDFGAPHETYLSEQFDKPVMIHRYPVAVKAFYMEPDPERPELALCVDMLAPEGYGEIIGGGQRIASLELLKQRIREHNLPEEAFEWYLDLRRYGSVPHAGFGLGIERTVAWICGLEHVREAIPFPRMLYRLKP
ncbi:MAG: asparagine--tRNA ligase [Blastocatellia bacterium]|nr:asparagine--tRNA ligase [Blastocatellia bacterium]MCS7156929.1 asparagine--tRNA ligase [Blastocatellia bacterium]MCX7752129.1 asparagine--tRNA ligase [Blastocatellia bacterium]MDW8167621.1 asparagine--tRNA ligase [Acidobacteriota bacterium]MDW8256221.1 asparagine--tRNA ligase [Acidobacteriota bacterium]